MTLDLPCTAETDVSQADGAPGEEGGETRKGQKPVENLASFLGDKLEIGNWGECEDEADRDEGSRSLINLEKSAVEVHM